MRKKDFLKKNLNQPCLMRMHIAYFFREKTSNTTILVQDLFYYLRFLYIRKYIKVQIFFSPYGFFKENVAEI